MILCEVCGIKSKIDEFTFFEVLPDKLVEQWGLSEQERRFRNEKESLNCPVCGSSLRSRLMARGIMKALPLGGKSLVEWAMIAAEKDIKIAEINYCGHLHETLSNIPGLVLSQYSESTFRARFFNWLKGIKEEDIMKLSYKDGEFDLVIHSEVLEHVLDPDLALSECRRVLKKGGVCVFSVPVMMKRKTKKRVERGGDGQLRYLFEPSYHGGGEEGNLVFWEFGGDFVKERKWKMVVEDKRRGIYVFSVGK